MTSCRSDCREMVFNLVHARGVTMTDFLEKDNNPNPNPKTYSTVLYALVYFNYPPPSQGVYSNKETSKKDSLSLSARQRAGGYRRAFLFPDDRQMALFLRGVEREDGAGGKGSERSGASPKI